MADVVRLAKVLINHGADPHAEVPRLVAEVSDGYHSDRTVYALARRILEGSPKLPSGPAQMDAADTLSSGEAADTLSSGEAIITCELTLQQRDAVVQLLTVRRPASLLDICWDRQECAAQSKLYLCEDSQLKQRWQTAQDEALSQGVTRVKPLTRWTVGDFSQLAANKLDLFLERWERSKGAAATVDGLCVQVVVVDNEDPREELRGQAKLMFMPNDKNVLLTRGDVVGIYTGNIMANNTGFAGFSSVHDLLRNKSPLVRI